MHIIIINTIIIYGQDWFNCLWIYRIFSTNLMLHRWKAAQYILWRCPENSKSLKENRLFSWAKSHAEFQRNWSWKTLFLQCMTCLVYTGKCLHGRVTQLFLDTPLARWNYVLKQTPYCLVWSCKVNIVTKRRYWKGSKRTKAKQVILNHRFPPTTQNPASQLVNLPQIS